MDTAARDRLRELVHDLTSTGQVTLDPARLGEVKRICKRGDAYVIACYDFLWERLKKEHSQVGVTYVRIGK